MSIKQLIFLFLFFIFQLLFVCSFLLRLKLLDGHFPGGTVPRKRDWITLKTYRAGLLPEEAAAASTPPPGTRKKVTAKRRSTRSSTDAGNYFFNL